MYFFNDKEKNVLMFVEKWKSRFNKLSDVIVEKPSKRFTSPIVCIQLVRFN